MADHNPITGQGDARDLGPEELTDKALAWDMLVAKNNEIERLRGLLATALTSIRSFDPALADHFQQQMSDQRTGEE